MNNESKGMLLGLIGISAFGLTLPATRVVIPYLDPIFIGLGRAVLAGLFAAIILILFRQKLPTKKQFYQLAIISIGVVIGFPVCSSWAMQYVPAAHGGVVLGILPLVTSLFGVLLGNERPHPVFWILSVLGSILVISYALTQSAGSIHIADVALLLAIILAALGYAVGANLSKTIGSWAVICWALVIALPFILAPTIIYAPESIANIPATGLVSFLYLAFVSQLFAFFVWYKGLALGGIARVSQVQLLQPFITIIAASLILGELIDGETIVFAILVAGCVWAGKRTQISKKTEFTYNPH